MGNAYLRLPVRQQSRIQCRPRTCFGLFRPISRGVLMPKVRKHSLQMVIQSVEKLSSIWTNGYSFGGRMKTWILASGMPIALATGSSARAADWTGLYIGAHSGFNRGSSNPVLPAPAPATTGNVFDGMIGGVQAGYNVQLPSGVLLGVEADISFPNYLTSNSVVSSLATARSGVTEQWDYVGTARGRIGYASGHWLAYATGGLAFTGERFINSPAVGDEEKNIHRRLGWAAGAGLEYGFAPHWSVRLEYLYSQFERADIRFASGAQYNSTLHFHSLR